MMEYGSLGGGVKLGSTGILQAGSNAGNRVGAAFGGGGVQQHGGTLGLPGRRPIVDQETASAYTALSNKVYLEAVKKEKAGALNDAFLKYGQSADLRLKIYGERDPAILQLYTSQAKIAMKQGKFPQAEETYRKMLSIVGKKNGPGSPEAKPIVSALATVCEKQKKYADAASMYKQLVAMEARLSGEACPDVLKTRLKLANSYLNAKQVPEAESSLKETIAAVDAMPTPDTATLLSALQTYSMLLKQEGRDDEAEPIDSRLAALGGSAGAAPSAPPAGVPPGPTPVKSDAPKAPDASGSASRSSGSTPAASGPAASTGSPAPSAGK
jgi:tetratricopeptide (TPR) repeat protein